jgi:hypothetical protein
LAAFSGKMRKINKAQVTGSMVGLIVVAVILALLLGPILYEKVFKTGMAAANASTILPEVPGVVKEGSSESAQYQSDPKFLKIRKVTKAGMDLIPDTPSSFDRNNWLASEEEISDKTILIYFDKELEADFIPEGYYEIFSTGQISAPTKSIEWINVTKDFQFVSSKDEKNRFYNIPQFKSHYYLIRFFPDKEYKDTSGKTWKISPATSTIKFEVN